MPIDDLTALGQKMREARKKKDLTQQELCLLYTSSGAHGYSGVNVWFIKVIVRKRKKQDDTKAKRGYH